MKNKLLYRHITRKIRHVMLAEKEKKKDSLEHSQLATRTV